MHDRYRSMAPSGENPSSTRRRPRSRHSATTSRPFERHSDDIGQVEHAGEGDAAGPDVYNRPGAAPSLAEPSPRLPARCGARAQHLPAAQPVGARRLPRGRRPGGGHAARLQAALRQWRLLPGRVGSATTVPTAIRCPPWSTVLPRIAGRHRAPVVAARAHRRRLARPGLGVRLHLRLAARADGGDRPRSGAAVREVNLVPYDGRGQPPDPSARPSRQVAYVGRLEPGQGRAAADAGLGRVPRDRGRRRAAAGRSPAAARCATT